jgi:hypothetical protein
LRNHSTALALGRRVGHRDRGQQRARVRVARHGIEDVRWTDLHDFAEIHHRDAVADVLDHRQVVRDEEVREPEPRPQVGQQVQHLRLDRHVERRRSAHRTR